MGATMSPQIEVEKKIAGESGPSSDAGTRKARRGRWLILAAALILTVRGWPLSAIAEYTHSVESLPAKALVLSLTPA